jgi:hypothetical protein
LAKPVATGVPFNSCCFWENCGKSTIKGIIFILEPTKPLLNNNHDRKPLIEIRVKNNWAAKVAQYLHLENH